MVLACGSRSGQGCAPVPKHRQTTLRTVPMLGEVLLTRGDTIRVLVVENKKCAGDWVLISPSLQGSMILQDTRGEKILQTVSKAG